MDEKENITPAAEDTKRELAVFAAIFTLVLAVYYQAVGFDFISLDDNLYVYANPVVLGGLSVDGIKWAFTEFHSANWHPLTWISHMADVSMFGRNPGGHHAVNVFLHLVNSVLAFVVFRRLTGRFWPSAAIALLFAVHPAHVESVAWISERKDVLSTLFMLLSIWAYAEYAETAKTGSGESVFNSQSYLLSLGFFALGLMSKPMLVTLPFVLLLIDHWPLGRLERAADIKRLLAEKVPFLVLSAGSAALTIMAQRSGGAFQALDAIPLDMRFMNAVVSYVKYIAMMFYPAGLGIWYPYPASIPWWQAAGAAAILAAITAVCLALRRHRYLLVGWLIFLGTLVPVIGIVQVGSQAMADRYTYVPYFGLFIMLAFGLDALIASRRQAAYVAIFAAASVALAAAAYVQTRYWKNSETIYARTLAVTEGNFLIGSNMCLLLATENRAEEAEPICRMAVAARPDFAQAHNSLGVALMKLGRYGEAETAFAEYVRQSRDLAGLINLATSQVLQNKPADAESNLKLASDMGAHESIRPTFAASLSDLAVAYARAGNHEKAAENLVRVIALMPDAPEPRYRLAESLYELGRYDDARQQADAAAAAVPQNAEVAELSGRIRLAQGKRDEAIGEFQRAIGIDPNNQKAKAGLEKARGGK